MPTIRIDKDVKKELEEVMISEIKKDINNPKVLTRALRYKYGYTHSAFISKLLKNHKKS